LYLNQTLARYIELEDKQAPRNAKFAPDGERFSKITFLDFNALYLWSANQKMPCTPGVLWRNKGSYFSKSLMTTNNSLKALQWLCFVQKHGK
jgi:hypothetical protein